MLTKTKNIIITKNPPTMCHCEVILLATTACNNQFLKCLFRNNGSHSCPPPTHVCLSKKIEQCNTDPNACYWSSKEISILAMWLQRLLNKMPPNSWTILFSLFSVCRTIQDLHVTQSNTSSSNLTWTHLKSFCVFESMSLCPLYGKSILQHQLLTQLYQTSLPWDLQKKSWCHLFGTKMWGVSC